MATVEHEGIGTGTAKDRVIAGAGIDRVIAHAGPDRVIVRRPTLGYSLTPLWNKV